MTSVNDHEESHFHADRCILANATKAELEQALKNALHDLDIARINIYTLKRDDDEVQAAFVKLIEDLETRIASGKHLFRDTFIESKSTMERTLGIHRTQYQSNLEESKKQLNNKVIIVDILKMEKIVLGFSEELEKLKREGVHNDKEREEKLLEIQDLLDVNLEALRRHQASLS